MNLIDTLNITLGISIECNFADCHIFFLLHWMSLCWVLLLLYVIMPSAVKPGTNTSGFAGSNGGKEHKFL